MSGYYDQQEEDNPTQSRVLGLVVLITVLITSGIALVIGSFVLGAFFTFFMPLATGLPVDAATVMSSIPTDAFIAYYIFVGGIMLIAIFGIYRIIFGH